MKFKRDPVAIRNERLKAFGQLFNALGVGLIGFALLKPATESMYSLSLSTLWWVLIGLALHGFQHYILTRLSMEDDNDGN